MPRTSRIISTIAVAAAFWLADSQNVFAQRGGGGGGGRPGGGAPGGGGGRPGGGMPGGGARPPMGNPGGGGPRPPMGNPGGGPRPPQGGNHPPGGYPNHGYRPGYGYGYYPGYRYYGSGIGFGLGLGFYGSGYGGYPYYYGNNGLSYYYDSNPIVVSGPASQYLTTSNSGETTLPQPTPVDPITNGEARITVVLPVADAKVWFNDSPTTTQGKQREYRTAGLEPNITYKYTIRAQWQDGGKTIEQTRVVPVQVGQMSLANFGQPELLTVPPKGD